MKYVVLVIVGLPLFVLSCDWLRMPDPARSFSAHQETYKALAHDLRRLYPDGGCVVVDRPPRSTGVYQPTPLDADTEPIAAALKRLGARSGCVVFRAKRLEVVFPLGAFGIGRQCERGIVSAEIPRSYLYSYEKRFSYWSSMNGRASVGERNWHAYQICRGLLPSG